MAESIPTTQTVAMVRELGGAVEFVTDYPVPTPGDNEVLAKVLYTGVCQSGTFTPSTFPLRIEDHLLTVFLGIDLHTKAGTAASAQGTPITNIKLPHIGGHEGVGRIVKLGPNCGEGVKLGGLVGIRFLSRVCRRCEFCLAGAEQYCAKSTNHLHHEDGSFQEYIALDADNLTILPDDVDAKLIGPVLCAGVTAYKAVLNANIKVGDWVAVVGAGGGLGHLAVQYARANGASVIAVDTGNDKREYLQSVGAKEFVDFKLVPNTIEEVRRITNGGAQAVIVAAGNAKAFAHAAEMLRIGGTLSCIGIPPGRPFIETPVASIVIRGLKITGNLIGSLKECMEAVELTRRGVVIPKVQVRPFRDLPQVYEQLESGDVPGRIVLQVAESG